MNQHPIETTGDQDLRLSQPAMQRAARRARALAAQTGTALVFSRNGVIQQIKLAPESIMQRLQTVKVLPNHRLAVTFSDGRSGTLNCSAVCQPGNHGIYTQLADSGFFAQVQIESGALTWPNGADLPSSTVKRASD